MRRGQVFTIDLFNAYGVFLLIMMLMMFMGLWVAGSLYDAEKNDEMHLRAMYAMDYMVYNDNLTYEPYHFRKADIDAFFSQGETGIRDTFKFGNYNYSMKVIQINGDVTKLEAGNESDSPKRAVALQRIARYDNQNAWVRVVIWER